MNDITTTQGMPPAERPIETITQEIQYYKTQVGSGIIEIGRRLVEAKRVLPQGEWLPYIKDTVEFSERTAQNFMRIAKEYTDPQTVADLGAAKAVCLLALTQEEREAAIVESHEVEGEEKSIYDMTKREVEKLTKEITEERKKTETIQFEYEEKEKAAAEKHTSELATAEKALEVLKAEMEELKDQKPPTVTAELDEASLEQIRNDAKAEAAAEYEKVAAELKKKIEAAEAEVKKAKTDEEKNRAIAKEAEERAEALAEEVEKAEKELKIAGSPEITEFKVYFDKCRSDIEEMKDLISHLREIGKEEDAEKLCKALNALCETGRIDD